VAGHEFPVAQHHHAVGDARDLVEPVADVNERDPFAPELIDLREKPLGFSAPERRGRLVENQQPGIERERFGDLDLLLRCDAQRADQLRRRNVEAEPPQLF
jgi:hypothetical protein